MHVSSDKVLWNFARTHPDAAKPLAIWLRLVQHGHFQNLVELKHTFASVDMVPVKGQAFYVFNIGGNKYRLIATIHFQAQHVFVRSVLTHADYSTDRWKKKL